MTTASAPQATPSNWNLPNAITVLRILLAPVFFALLMVDNGQDGALRWIAAVLFILAIATDGVDGYLARKNNQVTNLGKLLDPIADKVLTGAALIALTLLNELPWWVTAVILVREIGITIFRLAVAGTRVIPANVGGKIKTVVQAVAISFALLPLAPLVGEWINYVNMVLMGAAFAITVVTGAIYLDQDWKLNRPVKREGDPTWKPGQRFR